MISIQFCGLLLLSLSYLMTEYTQLEIICMFHVCMKFLPRDSLFSEENDSYNLLTTNCAITI